MTKRIYLAWIVLFLLSACAQKIELPIEDFSSSGPEEVTAMTINHGAIYQSVSAHTWFEDKKARRVGDLITIVFNEQTDASKTASTSASKDSFTSMANPTLFGSSVQLNVPGIVPLQTNIGNNLQTSIDASADFAGSGSSSQSNSLSGSITVTVSEVLANGNLRVRGEKRVRLNQGIELVQVSGIVRSQDIRTDNSVLSSQIADAQINYKGQGILADANANGWFSRLFMSQYWPF